MGGRAAAGWGTTDSHPPYHVQCQCAGALLQLHRRSQTTDPPPPEMEALRHEHERDLVEVKGIAVWILNVLVDATRHHGETETADQNSGLVDLH